VLGEIPDPLLASSTRKPLGQTALDFLTCDRPALEPACPLPERGPDRPAAMSL